MPARDQVPVEDTWNLDDIYADLAAWEADLNLIEDQVAAVTAIRGRMSEGAPTIIACLQARDAVLATMGKLGGYANLGVSTDGLSPQAQATASRALALGARVGAALSFIDSELSALPDGSIESYLAAAPALATYRLQLEVLLRDRPHMLAPETEQTLAALGEVLGAPAAVWNQATAVDLVCAPVRDAAGEDHPVSIAAYVFGQAQAPDRELRRRGYLSLAAGIGQHKATLATTLSTTIRRNVTLAKLRHYQSATEMLLEGQQVPEAVYRNVLNVVHDEIAPHYRRLMRLKQRVLGLDSVYRYDVDAPLDPDYEPVTSFAESGRTIRAGLAVLGEEYDAMLAAAFRDRWVDRAENLGKRSGAFCATVYGVHPYVFTTWHDNLRSTFILAHELGHAGHGALAGRNQVISNTRTTLFFVEAPSTANEMILSRHMLHNTDDARLRRWLILQSLGTFTHNMVTHLLEAHFEQRLYDLAEAGTPLTLATIMQVQGDLFERFYDGAVVVDDAARLYWAQQPHFYRGLYPYTYAAGLSCSTSIAEAIHQEGQPAVDRWLRTLKAGGTLPPIELMRMAGVDMTSAEPIRRAVAYFGSLVEELERSFA
ncbi:MAG: oligoendopeptidase F [Chloroflexota bacterium]